MAAPKKSRDQMQSPPYGKKPAKGAKKYPPKAKPTKKSK